MKTMELNKMGLAPISDLETKEITGGSIWKFQEATGYIVGYFIGYSLKLTRDIAQRILEHQALK